MSNKSARIVKRNSPPRAMTEIQQEYQELVFKAGQAQYQLYVIERDLAQTNFRLREVNVEAAARNELDKKDKEQNEQTPQ